jgi:hypothetical protein
LYLKTVTWGKITPRRWQVEAFEVIRNHLQMEGHKSPIISAIMGSGKSILIAALANSVPLESNEVVVVSTSSQLLVESIYDDFKATGVFPGIWYSKVKRMGNVIVTCVPSVKTLAARLNASGKRVKLWIADEAHKTECDNILDCYEALNPKYEIGFTATAFRSIKKETLSIFEEVIYKYSVRDALLDGVIVPWKIIHWGVAIPPNINDLYLEMVKEADGPGLANADDIKDAMEFADFLTKNGIPAKAIHSKLNPRIKKSIISDLRSGRIKCIVHVNMLSEGANFPFLKWAVLRRQVEARVRFIQEIGRLLRSYPGKHEAIFYDPHDLFGSFSLTYAEALGEVKEEEKAPKGEIMTPEEIQRHFSEDDPPMILSMIESTIRGLTSACDIQTKYPRRILDKTERLKPSKTFQTISVKSELSLCNGSIPLDWKNCINVMIEKSVDIRFGFMADLIWVLSSVRESGRWPLINTENRIGSI